MQKKNLFASAILMLCTLFVFTGCKEVMSSLDNPVSAYLKITEPAKTIAKSESFSVKDCYTTISDATPKFTTSAENIATVDANGKVKGISAGKAIITIEIPATDYYEAAIGQVEVTVDALLAIDAFNLHFPSDAKKTKNLFTDYHLSTKSDAAIQLAASEGSDKVFTLDPNTGDITPVHSGNGSIKISVPATASYVAEEMTVDVKVRINTFKELKNELTAEGVTEVKAYLADAANIVWEGDMLDVTGKKVAIIGGTNTTMAVKKGFQIDNDFSISNVKMDFTEQGSYFVGFKTEPTEVVKIGDVTFENIEAKNMKQPLFNSKKKNYLINNISIINSIVEMGASKNVLDFSSGSGAYNVNFKNSTFYASVSHTTATYKSQSGQDIHALDPSGVQTFNLLNSTFYKLSYGKNFFELRSKGVTYQTYNLKNNIFVDCGKSGQVVVGVNHGQTSASPTWDVDSNVFNYGGSDTSAAEVTKAGKDSNNKDIVQNSIEKVITFKDATKGDFTQSDAQVGDPRWIKK